MNLETALQKLKEYESAAYAVRHATSVLYTDAVTAAPKASYKGRGAAISYLSGLEYKLLICPEMEETLSTILSEADSEHAMERREAEVLKEEFDNLTRIPMEEFVAYQALLNDADAVWHEAKVHDDYASFAPYLEKIIAANKRFALMKDQTRPVYDTMLDSFEKGACMASLDPFFATVKNELTPLIHEIAGRPEPDTAFLRQTYPVEGQRLFSRKLMALEGIDPDRCTIGETEHPFTNGCNKWDVRITTHYHENDVISSLYSVIHEGGHALYEMGIDDRYQFTCLATGTSMGIHESQSRFYENIIGRSLPFCRVLLPIMAEVFPNQLKGVDPDQLYTAVNLAKPSLIRTEADELTYPLHVMIRYEMEKHMVAGDIGVQDLPALWNSMYREYLGLKVPSDREGILQDSHWSGGSLGYFPSYALGSAYGVQMLRAMEKEIDVWGTVEKADLSPITNWLGERIHRHGSMLTPAQALAASTGEPFDPKIYTGYLTRKFSALYGL